MLYTVTAADTSTETYTVIVTVAPAIAKAITAFSIDGVAGTINPIAKTISVTMPNGTNTTGTGPAPMIASYTATATDVRVATVLQTSPAAAARDFSSLVLYTVKAADNSTETYTVIVTVAPAIAKAITAYSIDGVIGTINPTTMTIVVTMPFGTDITGAGIAPMIASYTATAADVRVLTVLQASPATAARNFSSLVLYTVKAADNSTVTYTVFVTVAPAIAKAISSFSIDGIIGTIDPLAQTIAVTMPFGTNVTGAGPAPMIVTYTATATDVRVLNVLQTSPAMLPRDFSNLVKYTVKAADNSTAVYTVIVTVAPAIAKAITAYSIDGVIGTINPTTMTIAVTMPYGTDITGAGIAPMIASYTATAADVRVLNVLQTSPAAAARDFSGLVLYTVKAADNSTVIYTVIVTEAKAIDKAITAYSIDGVAGTINPTAKTILVNMPTGTVITGAGPAPMIASYTATATDVRVANVLQTSPAAAARDFSGLVVYTVKAADNSTVTYTVIVTVALTVPTPGPAGAAPNLKSVETYGIIASSAMTIPSSPLAHIYGDVALTTTDAFTGFALTGTIPMPVSVYVTPKTIPGINSTVHGRTDLIPQLMLDLSGTYADLMGRTPAPNALTTIASAVGKGGGTFPAGNKDLSGFVLIPGVYKVGAATAGDTIGLSNAALGPLVLDALGNADAVFVFQASDITTTTNNVILQGGAQAKNVFWVMAATATIGNGGVNIFQGTVVAGTTITVGGTNVQGRMLAGAGGTGALTITAAGSTITVP